MKSIILFVVGIASLIGVQGCIQLENVRPDITEINVTNFSPYSNTTAAQYARLKALEVSLRRHIDLSESRQADSVRTLIDVLSREVWMRLEQDLRSTLDTIPSLEYQLNRSTGMYLGDREPSMVVVLLEGETPLSRRAVHAISVFARNEAQQSMIVSQPVEVSHVWIGELEDGMIYEPSYSVVLAAGVYIDNLSKVLVDNGFPGFTIRHISGQNQLDVYYVPEFETDSDGSGRTRMQFMQQAELLVERLRQSDLSTGYVKTVRKLKLVELPAS